MLKKWHSRPAKITSVVYWDKGKQKRIAIVGSRNIDENAKDYRTAIKTLNL